MDANKFRIQCAQYRNSCITQEKLKKQYSGGNMGYIKHVDVRVSIGPSSMSWDLNLNPSCFTWTFSKIFKNIFSDI